MCKERATCLLLTQLCDQLTVGIDLLTIIFLHQTKYHTSITYKIDVMEVRSNIDLYILYIVSYIYHKTLLNSHRESGHGTLHCLCKIES